MSEDPQIIVRKKDEKGWTQLLLDLPDLSRPPVTYAEAEKLARDRVRRNGWRGSYLWRVDDATFPGGFRGRTAT